MEEEIEIDDYGLLTFETPEFHSFTAHKANKISSQFAYDTVSLSGRIRQKAKPMYIMKDIFFHLSCEKNKDKTRNLNLIGKNLEFKIGRRCQDWDIPYLLIYLTKHRNIVKLNLAYNEIKSAGFISLIDHIIRVHSIKELDLRYNEITDHHSICYMYNNASRLKLQTLRLSGNKMGIENAKKVALMLEKNKFIKHLDFSDVDHNETSLIYFATVLRSTYKYSNSTLKSLNLSRPIPKCMYSKLKSSHVASAIGLMLRFNTTLDELHLQKFSFFCHDIEDMFLNAKHNKNLKVLDLCCNNIGDYGVEIISKWLNERPPLQFLLLGHNIISNHGLRALSRDIPYSKLVMLDISHNRFDDQGAIELFHSFKKSPLIDQLRIFGNKIGHPTAKVVDRMLSSGMFKQSNIDVKPYKDGGIYYFAYYEPDSFEYSQYEKKPLLCLK